MAVEFDHYRSYRNIGITVVVIGTLLVFIAKDASGDQLTLLQWVAATIRVICIGLAIKIAREKNRYVIGYAILTLFLPGIGLIVTSKVESLPKDT